MKHLQILVSFCLLLSFLAPGSRSEDPLQSLTDPDLVEKLSNMTIKQILPNEVSMDNVDTVIKEKCQKNGHNESYEEVMDAKQDFNRCLRKLLDFVNISKEIEEAKPKGDLDMVFKKYCSQTPGVEKCLHNFLTVLEQCFDENEKTAKENVLNVTRSTMNFVCNKGGDRIALFIAEGGPECINDKLTDIQECLKSNNLKNYANSSDTIPNFAFNKEQCSDIDELKECMVERLEKCKEPTPANIVHALFKYVLKSTACKEHLQTSGVAPSFGASSLLLVAFLPLIFRF